MAYCSKCGAQVNDDATYCHNCGASLENNKPDSQNPWYTQPNSPVTNNAGLNKFALLGFIFSALSLFLPPALGMAFSIVGLVQIKKRGQRGKGFAIAGIILSAIALIINLIFVIYYAPELMQGLNEGSIGSFGDFGGSSGPGYYGT